MFDFIDFESAVKEVVGKQYDKDALVSFTIMEVKPQPQYKNFTVSCVDEEGNKCDFRFGGDNMSSHRKKAMIAFLSAFFSREDLIARKANPVELVGQRFEAKSNGIYEKEGKKYQQWQDNFRKLEAIATADEFQT